MHFADVVGQSPAPARRFAVAWRNRIRQTNYPVGVLDYTPADSYRFSYLHGVETAAPDFRAFIGFPDLDVTYTARQLWPFFDLRIMDRKRPDFREYAGWLGLGPDASRLDLLARSGGGQKGDTVSMAEAPPVSAEGEAESVFLLRGVSHAIRAFDTQRQATTARAGTLLQIVRDSANVSNREALLITNEDGAALGWVPDLLIPFARQISQSGGQAQLLQNNGDEAPWHARLLVRLSGHVSKGSEFFTDGIWPSRLAAVS